MMNYLQRIGRSLMLPVAVLPAAAILMGIGYWIETAAGESIVSGFLVAAGRSLISGPSMAILFAVGVAFGMSKNKDGSAALSGLVAYLVATTLLSVESVSVLQGISEDQVGAAFVQIETQFIGILSGIIASIMYNRFSHVELPAAFSFFSGKRLVPIMTAAAMLVVSSILLFIWPPVFNALVSFGTWISQLQYVGAGLYGFFNRLLIPTGLHHALNSVFWFDVAGINDIPNFWAGEGELGITGRYQAGFFPVMMFGLPAAALAMYHTAKTARKKQAASLLLAVAFASFFTGVTEPFEFAFMFVAPALYFIHAILTGISLAVAAFFGWTAGFGFSAGFIDYLLSFNLPLANKPYMLLVQGLVIGLLYYAIFRFLIVKFNLPTPGREENLDVMDSVPESTLESASSRHTIMATTIYAALGGDENVTSLENCVTRLRVEVKDMDKVDQARIKSTGVPGMNIVSAHNIQVVVGPQVQFVADEIEKIRNIK